MNEATMGTMGAMKTAVLGRLRRAMIASRLDERLARRTQGKAPRSLLARLAPMHTLYDVPSVRHVVRDGLTLELDVSDYMQWCAFYGIATEPRQTLYDLAKPGDVVLDVGTNVGETLLQLGRRVGPGGTVHGFEINPETLERCRRNVARNALAQVRVHGVGLGAAPATLALERSAARNSGGDRLREVGDADHGQLVAVEVTTLDHFAANERLARIDLIKIDVEGFETNVIRGGRGTLRTKRPALFVEVSDGHLRQQGSSAAELVGELAALGYRMRHAETGAPVSASDRFGEGTLRHFDVIATPA